LNFTCIDTIIDNDMDFSHFQAQRDYFGAHTYELLDNPGKFEENISKTITIILYEDQDCLDN
jgi:6-phosphogluconate dehydrogenase